MSFFIFLQVIFFFFFFFNMLYFYIFISGKIKFPPTSQINTAQLNLNALLVHTHHHTTTIPP